MYINVSLGLLFALVAAQSLQGMRPIDQPVQGDALRRTPLMIAISRGDFNEVKRLVIDESADVNRESRVYGTPLHVAATKGNPEIVEFLLKRGAKVNSLTPINGSTPLAEAALHGKLEAAKILLDYGANPDINDNMGNTVLSDAIRGRLVGEGEHFEIIKLLIARGVNPWITDGQGRTAVALAEELGLTDIAKFIKRHSMQVSIREKGQGTKDIN